MIFCFNKGDQIVFIFPDMKTVMVGKFEKSVMISAQVSKISAGRCKDQIKVIKVNYIRFLKCIKLSQF